MLVIVIADEHATCRPADEHEGTGNFSPREQFVQISVDEARPRGVWRRIAPSHAGAIVAAYGGEFGDERLYELPRGVIRAESVFEEHGRYAGPGAKEVHRPAANVEPLARHRIASCIACGR